MSNIFPSMASRCVGRPDHLDELMYRMLGLLDGFVYEVLPVWEGWLKFINCCLELVRTNLIDFFERRYTKFLGTFVPHRLASILTAQQQTTAVYFLPVRYKPVSVLRHV